MKPESKILAIIDRVCVQFGVTKRELLLHCRQERLVAPRHVCFFLLRNLLPAGQNRARADIGRLMRRDHHAIFNGIQQVKNRMDTEPKFKAQVERLVEECSAL